MVKIISEETKRKAENKKEKELEKRTTENGGFERRDYDALKKEYVTGEYGSLSDFKRAKGIPLTVTAPFVGWPDDRKVYRHQLTKNALDLKRVSGATVEEVKQKQLNIARFLQEKALAYYESSDFVIKQPDDALRLVRTAMELERKLSGMEGDGLKMGGFTQININGKTNIDKLLEKADADEILRYIADTKRFRAGKSGENIISGSEQEIEEGEVL